MRVLVVGSGGREHAIVWKLSASEKVSEIFAAPGNGGTAREGKARNIPIDPSDIEGLLKFSKENGVDLTVVGPEKPLADGIVDRFEREGQTIFGPVAAAARIEASKLFAKEILEAADIPTAEYKRFSDIAKAMEYLSQSALPIVLKADGLAGGKGVAVARTLGEARKAAEDILVKKLFGDCELLIEEFLTGDEVSLLALTDGESVLPLPSAQDHKAVFDGDAGANTGGMGAYSPADTLKEEEYRALADIVITPVIKEFAKRGIRYKGVLYAGLMTKREADGGLNIKVLEYNCRFGDPETQAILARLETDITDIFLGVVHNRLKDVSVRWKDGASICVIMASGGYPGAFKKGYPITGLDIAELDGVKVIHSGTLLDGDILKTDSGRVLSVTAAAENLDNAISKAYAAVKKINFNSLHYRTDIGKRIRGKVIL
ncbi:MAG: phosphoribosylamine--glycine ligase [Deferribacteraceae bacterium]|jgi:phosphoribosylamine--glycine ligase|nr:phosphoribosylamine--glycine ligase [Deferribacteraceae bacterium]